MVTALDTNLQSDRPLPEVLYHYTSQSGLLGMLETRSIWASKIQYLNDYREFRLGLGVAQDLIAHHQSLASGHVQKKLLEEIVSDLEKIGRTNICVCAFSEEGDLLSQWRGYCAQGIGYSIGFDSEQLSLLAKEQNFLLSACEYNPDVQRNKVQQFIWSRIQESLDRDVATASWRVVTAFAQFAATLKHPSFSEESEWRLVSGMLDSRQLKYREGPSMVIPYFPFSLGKLPIREIIIGPTPHPDLARDSLAMMLSSKQLTEWGIRNSMIPYRNW